MEMRALSSVFWGEAAQRQRDGDRDAAAWRERRASGCALLGEGVRTETPEQDTYGLRKQHCVFKSTETCKFRASQSDSTRLMLPLDREHHNQPNHQHCSCEN